MNIKILIYSVFLKIAFYATIFSMRNNCIMRIGKAQRIIKLIYKYTDDCYYVILFAVRFNDEVG